MCSLENKLVYCLSGQAFFDKIVKKERSLGRVVGLHIEVKEICEIDVFYKLLYISFSKNMKNRPEPRKKTMLETHYYFTPILDHLEEFDHNDWHLYPIVTLPAAKQLRDEEDLPKTISSLNACYDRLQKVSLDYLTVNLYGRKQGRLFLLLLQDFLEENKGLMGVISSLKVKLKEVQNEYDQTIKSVKMLNSGTDNLDSILNLGQNGSS